MPTFQTAEGQPPVEITGVGIADQHGIHLDRAALSMSELQKPELDEHGEPTGGRVPLEGLDLLEAAREWSSRAGLIVVDDGTPAAEPIAPDKTADTPGTGETAAASDPKLAAAAATTQEV